MATQLQIRRGTTAQMNAFTGAEGELAVNTSTDTVHVHDGATAGGFALAKADGSNIATYAGSFTTLAASGAVTLSSTLAVTGTATMDGLTVDGNDSYTSNIKFDYGASAPTYFANWGYKSSSDGNKVFLTITDAGAAKDVLVANYNGNVGIGTSSPSYPFHLSGSGDTVAAVTAGASSIAALNLGNSTYLADGGIRYDNGADALILRASNAERMRLSGGSVGIGVSNPSDYYANNLVVTGPSEGGITIASTGNHTNYLLFADSTSGVARYAGMIEYAHSIDQMAFRTNSIQRMAIDSAGRVGIGCTPSYLIHADAVTSTDPSYFVASSGSDFVVAMGSQNSPGVAQEAFIGTISNDSLKIKTNNTERLRIDGATGNVGIGSVPPAWGSAYISVNVGTAGSFWGTKTGASLVVMSDNTYFDGASYRARNTGAASKYFQNAGAHYWDRAASVSAGATQSNVTGMTLDSSGNLLVGTSSSGARLRVTGAAGASASIVQVGTNGYPAISFNNTAGVQQGYIVTTASAVSLVSVSDQRLKQNIADADDAGSKLDAIQVRQFDWIADGSHQEYGMVAQELQIVAPEAVHQPADSEEMMGVDYSKLVPMLVKEIQSLRTRVQELENN